MSKCTHELYEMETACADGMCPICLAVPRRSGDFLNIAMDQMVKTDPTVTSFELQRLDENGSPVAIPDCETVAVLSVEDQRTFA